MNPPPSEFRVAHSDRICKVCILLKCTDIIHRIWSQGSSCKINIFQAKHLFLRSHINNIVESCFAYLPHVLQAQVHVRSPFRSGKRCFVVVLAFDNLLLLLTSSFSTFICQYIHSSQLRTDFFFFYKVWPQTRDASYCHGIGICLSHFLVYFESSPSLCHAFFFASCLCLFSCPVLCTSCLTYYSCSTCHPGLWAQHKYYDMTSVLAEEWYGICSGIVFGRSAWI